MSTEVLSRIALFTVGVVGMRALQGRISGSIVGCIAHYSHDMPGVKHEAQPRDASYAWAQHQQLKHSVR